MARGGRAVQDMRMEEEKHLSDVVYFGLYALTKARKPTREFEKIFKKDLFLKPNQGALIHVMHFLFTIYDSEDFRKRFFWPLHNDREAEKTFRATCLTYLLELNERFNLQMVDISTYIFLFPGGFKFLKIMEKLIKFITIEEVKKRNEGGLLDEMTVALGNRTLRQLVAQKEALDKIAGEKMDFCASEQQRLENTLDDYQKKIEALAIENGMTKDYLLSEEFQAKEMEKIQQRIEKMILMVDSSERYCENLRELKNKMKNMKTPIISTNLIQRTEEAASKISKRFPAILDDFGDNGLSIDGKVNVNFVGKLTNFSLPHLQKILVEEIDRRAPTVAEETATYNTLARKMVKMSVKLNNMMMSKSQDCFPDDRETENVIASTPGFKFNNQPTMKSLESKHLIFQDCDVADLQQLQLNQLHEKMSAPGRLGRSNASLITSSMKTVAKPNRTLQYDALSVLALTEKRPKARKMNAVPLDLFSHHKGKSGALNHLDFETPNVSYSQTSKISIDGRLPLGSSSMIIGSEKEMERTASLTKYEYSPSPGPSHRADEENSPSGFLKPPKETIFAIPKLVFDGIQEENNSSQKANNSFESLFPQIVKEEEEESLFNISDGVLQDVE
ncbi:uncharacterized protein LOC132260847 [Phlebotomus argentipes]|uniref:uncharacterized protein LOC132260847 n=1 Tax=Phlebotomus argentipes TaxID=94469 RepID=UPI0028936FE1|nr:uncharacterized protein LOC132260847 [Phlebotomus argentipes]XP_059615201.1 uncharacterized protein LOC132260847 [Phlebotomus argentipes]